MAKVPKYVRRKYLAKRDIQITLSPNPFGVFHLVKTDTIMTPDQLLQCVDRTSLLNKQQRLTAKTCIDKYGRKIEGKKTVDDEEK